MKKYKDLYELEKQRHEEALQRYQENHADEMEIINIHKKCSKKERKEPKKALDDLNEEEQKSKKTDGKKTTTKQSQKVPKIPEFVDVEQERQPKKASKTTEYSDDEQGSEVTCIVMYSTENEQDPTVKQPQKVPKTPEFVDTDSDDEQEPTPKHSQKASKASEFVDDEQGPAVKCIVMYSTEDEQGSTIKKPQKPSPALVKPEKILKFAAVSCAYILNKGVRNGKQ